MSYLIQADYKKLIQTENLSQIIGNDFSILDSVSLSAIQTATSYLTQKYITGQEFQDTAKWNSAVVYKATNRVYLDAAAYVTTNTYNVGDLTLQAGNISRCNTGATTGAFDPTKWDLLGAQYAIFYAAYPNPLFILSNTYLVGDLVFWNTSSWRCQIATVGGSHEADLQAVYSQQIPYNNSFPGSPGQTQWVAVVPIPYVVPAATDILNTTYWTPGDSRNQELLNFVMDIALYRMHKRIAPRNIPDLRIKAYDDAIKWLRDAGDVGNSGITADLPVKQPKSGGRIRWGGNVRTQTGY
jgi:hypothetical protein